MTSSPPAAVLWDMDGTIVDTEPYWMRAETELVARSGGVWTHDQALALVGLGLWDSAAILQRAGVDLPADDIVHSLTERVREQLVDSGVPWRPGARELLRALRDEGVPTALVTMSIASIAGDVRDAIPFDAFDVLVTGDAVDRPKPHPDAYLRAAELLGVDIRRCVAIEDSPNGLASAVASGAAAIAVPMMVPIEPGPGFTLWSTLAGRTPADVAAVLAATGETAGRR